jgi:hypothetical protein
VIGRRTIRLRVEQPAPRAVSLWLARGAGAVLVTACAPRGVPRRAAAERAAMRRLRARVLRLGLRHAAAEGGDPAGVWPAEPSLLIPVGGIARAAAWGRALAQNAVLWVPRRGAVRLLCLR